MKRITSFFAVLLIAMTAFATGITGGDGVKFYLDLTAVTSKVGTGGSGYYPAPYYFANGETTSETFNLEHEADQYYEISVPEGTWTGFYIKLSMYSIELTLDGEHNCFVAKKNSNKMEATAGGKSPIFGSMMWWDNAGGTWSTVVPAGGEEEPEEPIGTVITGGTKLYLDIYWMGALKKNPITTTFSDGTNEVSLNEVDTINATKCIYSVTVPEGNWTSLTYTIGTYTLNLKEYDGAKTYFKVYAKFENGKVGCDADGIWMQCNESGAVTFPKQTEIPNKHILYFAPGALADACDTYSVMFVDGLGNMCSNSKAAMTKLSDGNYYFANNLSNPMKAGSFSIFCYKAGECVARFDNLTWDGTTSLFTVNDDLKTGTWSEYTEPERVINAAWTIENNVTGFSSVQVTFSGIDPNGRLLGGDATGINLVANFAKVASFFKVDETGKEVAVATLTNKNNGFLTSTKISDFTYELSLVPDAYELVDGKYMREGHYRIKIQKSHVQIEPKPLNALNASQDFVFDFTIENDYVFPTVTKLDYYVVDIESGDELESSVVSEISNVAIAFDDVVTLVSERPETPTQETWPYIHYKGTSYLLNCEVVDDYYLEFTIAEESIEKFTEAGLYTITIPEGFIYFGEPAAKIINTEISFGLTIGTAMPANGVIYFDPAGRLAEEIDVKFVAGNGTTKNVNATQFGGLYKIVMPTGNEWVSFSVDGRGDDPNTPESNTVTLYYVSDLFYTGEYNLFTLNADAPNQATAENGVWSNHVVQPIQGGTHFYFSIASSPYFAENPQFSWKTTFVDADDNTEVVEMNSIDNGIFEIVAPEGTWSMFYITLIYNEREFASAYIEYDGERNMFALAETANPYGLPGTMSVYNTEVPEVIATWSIEEGAVLESFTGVTVTFSGVDPRGRKVDGTEVTRVYPLISAVQTFFVVNEDGTTTPVVADENESYSGILTCSSPALTATLSLGTDRYTLVDGAFLKNGNYRIVLPANKVQYQPKVDGANVFGDKDFVLNFSIVNDYVEPEEPVFEEVEVPFNVSVENNSTVAELSEIVITYPDVARIQVLEPMAPQTPATWVFLSQTLVDENGNVTASQAMAPLYWQKVSANSFKVMVNLSAIGGPETLAMEGTYSIDVPAGLVMFSETAVNKAFSLYYTIKAAGEDGPTVDVENVTLSNIFVQNGMIMADGEFEIFTITGQNVTDMNGNLQNGVYVVRNANAATKVIVK